MGTALDLVREATRVSANSEFEAEIDSMYCGLRNLFVVLLDFHAEFHLGSLPHFETFKIRQLSPTMKALEPVKY